MPVCLADLRQLVIPLSAPNRSRLEAVRQCVIGNKSFRQLALEAGCDEGTIRREYKKLVLPPEYRDQVFAGRNFEAVKQEVAGRHAQDTDSLLRRNTALEREPTTGELSDALRDSILAFLDPPNDPANRVILEKVEVESGRAGDVPESWHIEDHYLAWDMYKPAPKTYTDKEYIAGASDWAFKWLLRAEPQCQIRSLAINKAQAAIQALKNPNVKVKLPALA